MTRDCPRACAGVNPRGPRSRKLPSLTTHATSARAARARNPLPGLNGRSVRNLRHVQAVRALRRAFIALIAGAGVIVAASIAVPSYAHATAEEAVPRDQVLTVDPGAPAVTVVRDNYTVTAPPPLRWPLDSLRIADGYGPRPAPCSTCSTFHKGIDFDPGWGAQVHSIAAGVVVETNGPFSSDYGVHVTIEHVIDGEQVTSLYGHMQYGSMTLSVGDVVTVGQVIGLVGSTGESTGAHLHFEIRPGGASTVNPMVWMRNHLD